MLASSTFGRPEFLARSADAIVQARQAPGCADFVVAAHR
jgi:hypothetical protein